MSDPRGTSRISEPRPPFVDTITAQDITELRGFVSGGNNRDAARKAREMMQVATSANADYIGRTFEFLWDDPRTMFVDCAAFNPYRKKHNARITHTWDGLRREHTQRGAQAEWVTPTYEWLALRLDRRYQAQESGPKKMPEPNSYLFTPLAEYLLIFPEDETDRVGELAGSDVSGLRRMDDVAYLRVGKGEFSKLNFRPGGRKTGYALGKFGYQASLKKDQDGPAGFGFRPDRDSTAVILRHKPAIWMDHPEAGRVHGSFSSKSRSIVGGHLPTDEGEFDYRWQIDGGQKEGISFGQIFASYRDNGALNGIPMILYMSAALSNK